VDNSERTQLTEKPIRRRENLTNARLLKSIARGESQAEIARKYNVTRQAVNKRFARLSHLLDPQTAAHFEQHEQTVLSNVKAALVSEIVNPAKLKKLNSRDAAISYGVIYDKLRLSQGKSTQNIATSAIIADIDAAIDAISGAKDVDVDADSPPSDNLDNTAFLPQAIDIVD